MVVVVAVVAVAGVGVGVVFSFNRHGCHGQGILQYALIECWAGDVRSDLLLHVWTRRDHDEQLDMHENMF